MLKTLIAPLSVGVLVLTAQSASAAIVEQDTFDVDNEFWSASNNVDGPLTVANSLLSGTADSDGGANDNDPQIQRGAFGKDPVQDWLTFTIDVRETTASGDQVVEDTTGMVLIFQNPNGPTNFGAPTLSGVSGDFTTFTWDISEYSLNSTGIIRLDPIGGPGTAGHSFDIDTITARATPIPEPASLALLGLGTLAILGRRRG